MKKVYKSLPKVQPTIFEQPFIPSPPSMSSIYLQKAHDYDYDYTVT